MFIFVYICSGCRQSTGYTCADSPIPANQALWPAAGFSIFSYPRQRVQHAAARRHLKWRFRFPEKKGNVDFLIEAGRALPPVGSIGMGGNGPE